jgi:hypothetical protein
LPALILAGWVANLRGAAAHKHDRLMAALLKEAQEHDRNQAPDMQRIGRAIITDIGGQRSSPQFAVKSVEIGAVLNETAIDRGLKKIRFDRAHGRVTLCS